MLKHGWIFLGILPWFLAGIAHAVVPEVNLTLAQAEEQALAFSPALKAKRAELAASEAKVDAQTALLWPRLTLEGSWRYVTEVPELSILPGRPVLPFGDHNNYSVGPMLSWNFWDAGGAYYARLTARSAQQAKADEVQGLERSLKLQVRTAYFQAQMASAQVRLLVDAFKLFNAQYQDIRTQYRAGASTRIDSLSSHQDLLSSQRQLQQAGNALAATLRDLFNLTGGGAGLDFSRPWGADLAKSMPSDLETPTLWLTLDPLETALQRFKAAAAGNFNTRLPQIQMLADLAEMTRAYASALGAGHWPKIQASAKSSLDYPNGPVLESVRQNTLAVNGSLSLFEFGRIRAQTAEQEQLAQAVDWQRESSLRNLQVSWQKACDQMTELKAEEALDQQAVTETEALAQLVYDAYRAGRSGYLEVQSANFRALSVKIQAVRTHVQMLIQLALLDSLSENEVK